MTPPSLDVYSVMRSSTDSPVSIKLVHMDHPPLVGEGGVVTGEVAEEPGGPGDGAREDIECVLCLLACRHVFYID